MSAFSAITGIVASLSVVSQIFILAIVLTWLWFNVRFNQRVVESGPTILTTLGIFGTFLGVALGLSHFDTANVQAGVPALLAGLKTAFWASVVGVGGAVQLKIREFLAGSWTKKKKSEPSAVSPLTVLVEIREALSGYGSMSLAQQIRMLRQDMGDRLIAEIVGARKESVERLDALRLGQKETLSQMELAGRVQQKALHQLAGGATESLVGALQRVVTDFNHKVASQFGENYRDVAEAVRQLLAWQEEYRETIRGTNLQLADTLRQLGYAAGDFRTVTTGSERFAQTAERVAVIMNGIEAGEERLMALARGMARVTEDAAGRIPFIENRMAELTSQMTRAVQENQVMLNQALTGSAAALQATVRTVSADLTGAAQAGTSQVQANERDISAALEANAAAMARALQANAAAMTGALQAMQVSLVEAVGAFEAEMAGMIRRGEVRMVALEEQAAASLTQSVGNLAGHLAAQLEAAGAGLAERPVRPRPVLHVVGEAVAVADE